MDYKVLYRKYRPKDFSSIMGQDYIVTILKNAIKKNKISHAYIFAGPRGTGKTTTAKVFSKAINCLEPTDDGPCGKCESCLNFKNNADIIEIDAASNNGVDEIREIINNIKLAPSYSKYKVYIIDEVHMLSSSAFNALLLTLEEPPKHIVFILATTNIEAVPITILSRCQRFDFHKISVENILKNLKSVAQEEKIDITDEALEEIAYISEGGMRDALSILDQLSSNNEKIGIDEVVKHFGSVSKKQINDLYNLIINNDIKSFVDMMDKFKVLSIDYKLLIKKLLEKIEEEAINSRENIDYNGLSYQTLKGMAFDLASISNYVNITINPYILIEITLLNYFPGNNLKENMEIKEDNINIENKDVQANQVSSINKKNEVTIIKDENLIKIRINNCLYGAKKEFLNNLKVNWASFINSIQNNKGLLNLLVDSNIVVASNEYAIIDNNLEETVNLINTKLEELQNEFQKICHLDYKFIAITNARWEKEKVEYINNLKNKKTYEKMKEPVKDNSVSEDLINDIDDIEKTAFEIFGKDKVEIE